MYTIHPDFRPYVQPSPEALDQILESKVLKLDGLDSPMIIKSIELLYNGGSHIVRTTTKDGLVGIAPANNHLTYAWPLLQIQIAPFFIGKDARDIEDLIEGVYVIKLNYKISGVAYYSCLSALELSILDLLAKAKGVRLGELFGPRIHDKVNIYVASGNRGNSPEEELAILQERVNKSGAKAIKFKIGGRMSKNADSLAGRSEELIYLTRKTFGDDFIIHADGNGSYDDVEGIRYGKILEDINAYFYEEPCPFDNLINTKKVADAMTIPLAFGEQETSLNRFRWLILNHGCDVVQPDILYFGGLIRTTKVARMADLAGMTITPHVSGGFCFVYILHLTSYTPNIGNYQESKKSIELTNRFLDGQIELKDGVLNIPDTIGLGIREDNEIIQEAYQIFDVH